MTQAIIEGTLNELANPIFLDTEDFGKKRKIQLHDDEYEIAVWAWTNEKACEGKWAKGDDYEAIRKNVAVAMFFGE